MGIIISTNNFIKCEQLSETVFIAGANACAVPHCSRLGLPSAKLGTRDRNLNTLDIIRAANSQTTDPGQKLEYPGHLVKIKVFPGLHGKKITVKYELKKTN